MLTPRVAERLESVVKMYADGDFTDVEFTSLVTRLVVSGSITDILPHIPAELKGGFLAGLPDDCRDLADAECLQPLTTGIQPSQFHYGINSRDGHPLLDRWSAERRRKIAVVHCPSYDPVWTAELLGNDRMGYTLAVAVEEFGEGVTAVRRAETTVEPDIAQGLIRAWVKMLRRVRYPERARVGLDGTFTYFAARSAASGYMFGETWSPVAGSASFVLVRLAESVRRFVEADAGGRPAVEAEIRERVAWFDGTGGSPVTSSR